MIQKIELSTYALISILWTRSSWEAWQSSNSKKLKLQEGDVRRDEKNRAHWKTGIIYQLLPGRDGITRVVKLCARKSYLERAASQEGVITTGLGDCHKMILTCFRYNFSRLPPKTATYRSFIYFESKDFLYELKNKLHTKECNGRVKYNDLTNIFRSTLDSHAPLKKKNK